MKLVCDACGTKYSIGDDRVAGKVFKIRCKKCSHIIIVRGVVAPVEAVVVAPVDEWHAVIAGEQVGPFDSGEVSRRRDAGELDDDSYMWREGMADWAPLGSIDVFRVAPVEVPRIEVVDATTPPADTTRLRGERNESSVLFTLGNLAKLAATPGPVATATPASGEGSGLIDIRALASSLAPAATAQPSTTGSMADLPVYTPSGFGEPIVLVPLARKSGLDRKLIIAFVSLVAMLAITATVLVIVLTRNTSSAEAKAVVEPTTRAARVAVAEPPTPMTPELAAPTPAPAPAAAPPAPAPAPAHPTPAPTTRTTTTARRTTTPPTTNTTATTTSTRTTVPTQLTPKPPVEDKCTEVTCAFSGNAEKCCEIYRPKTRTTTGTPAAGGDLPEGLDRTALTAGIATIKAQSCGGQSSARGDVNVSVKVSPAGTVTDVTIKNSPDPALSACVTAAAKRGSFAKTKRGGKFAYFWRF
jgi:predicted Zn finger-like uncharacterized protein